MQKDDDVFLLGDFDHVLLIFYVYIMEQNTKMHTKSAYPHGNLE